MPTEVDREAFLRLMGLTAADVADPDSVPKRTPSRKDTQCKVSSSTVSSTAGLSPSTSLRGDPDPLLNSYNNTKSSLNEGSLGTKLSSDSINLTGPTAAPLRTSARTVSFEIPPHRSNTAAAAAASPRAASISDALKEEGNLAFEAGLFTDAIRHYSAAIEALIEGGAGTDSAADPRERLYAKPNSPITTRSAETELLAALYSNRSAAYLQAARQWGNTEEAYGRALCDADRAVALRPAWFKGYSRQGDAYFKLHSYGAAAEAYEMALQLDPRNSTLVNALAETRQRAKESAREELEMRRTLRATGGSHVSSVKSSERGFDVRSLSGSDLTSQRTTTTSTPPFGETAHMKGGGRRLSGQAVQLWDELKHEVEATAHCPTGDEYRLQQLERFRKRGGPTNTPQPEIPKSEQRSKPCPQPASARMADPPLHSSEYVASANEKKPSSTMFVREDRPVDVSTSSQTLTANAATTTTASAAAAPSSSPVPPRHRSSYSSPTAGGIPAAMASFSGPVTNARSVPYEFSSAAAAAYQQTLLEAFRRRKAQQGGEGA